MYSPIAIEWPKGYIQKTEFFQDFVKASESGLDAVKAEFKRKLAECGRNCIYCAELVIILNGLCFNAYAQREIDLAIAYQNMLKAATDHAKRTLYGESLSYFTKATGCRF